ADNNMPLTTDVAPLVFDHFDCQAFDANTAARRLFGDLAAVNVLMLGFAFQRGFFRSANMRCVGRLNSMGWRSKRT
ncbi:MAG: hypothetical protein VX187_03665, partial [Pseudomonadota bacterium]|nr:hypothetical protein [Pseudomonadota bacterium]